MELQIALKKARKLKLQEAVTESKNSIEKVHNRTEFVQSLSTDVMLLPNLVCKILSQSES